MSLRRALNALSMLCCLGLSSCQKSPPAKPDASLSGQSQPADRQVAAADSHAGVGSGSSYASGSHQDEPFDPVATNGAIFDGWATPQVALVFTGEQDGYFEPCGCAGPNQQKGGVSRRKTFFDELVAKGWTTAAFDLGGLVHRYGRQSEIKFQIAVEAMKAMNYRAIGYGPNDLKLPAGTLLLAASEFDNDERGFVSANVGLFSLDTPRRYLVFEAGGRRMAVTSVLCDSQRGEINNSDLVFADVGESLAEIAPKMSAESDFQILLSHGTPDEAAELGKRFAEFDVIVTAGGGDEPPYEPIAVDGLGMPVIEVGHKGKYAVVLGLYDDPRRPIRYQRVPLDSRFADSEEMRALMTAYQDQLRDMGLEGLEVHALPGPRSTEADPLLGQFTGSAKCGECHTQAYAKWATTKHAHATESLVKAVPPRQFDPECLSCHTTGWNPHEYFPYETGFASLETTPALAANGCENCHGPGAAHVAAEGEKNLSRREQLRQAMRLTRATAEEKVCRECHDLDNSPLFDFAKYWPQVEHKGKK